MFSYFCGGVFWCNRSVMLRRKKRKGLFNSVEHKLTAAHLASPPVVQSLLSTRNNNVIISWSLWIPDVYHEAVRNSNYNLIITIKMDLIYQQGDVSCSRIERNNVAQWTGL